MVRFCHSFQFFCMDFPETGLEMNEEAFFLRHFQHIRYVKRKTKHPNRRFIRARKSIMNLYVLLLAPLVFSFLLRFCTRSAFILIFTSKRTYRAFSSQKCQKRSWSDFPGWSNSIKKGNWLPFKNCRKRQTKSSEISTQCLLFCFCFCSLFYFM